MASCRLSLNDGDEGGVVQVELLSRRNMDTRHLRGLYHLDVKDGRQ